jgi:uncharacterized protein (DUF1015 family)
VAADRLRLRMAVRAQFSQIFMLYKHHGSLTDILASSKRECLFEVEDDRSCLHMVSRINDQKTLKEISRCFERMPLYIADGHHRYTTAIRYRKEMIARHGNDPCAPYNYTMAYLVDAADPGLLVLPTHRIVTMPRGMDWKDTCSRLAAYFYVEEMDIPGPAQDFDQAAMFARLLSKSCPQGLILLFGNNRHVFSLCPREEAYRKLLKISGHKELARLQVVVLEELILKKTLGIDVASLEIGKDIIFTADSEGAILNLKRHQMLFFMCPTPVQQVLDVADAGLTMPHKSTYFYPKILTGMILNIERG